MKYVAYDFMALGPTHCPLFHCWRLKLGPLSFRIHHFINDGPADVQHNHTWWFMTFVLKGSYVDVTPHGRETMRAGRVALRSANHRHAVIESAGCWTFVINGPYVRPRSEWWHRDVPCDVHDAEALEGVFACDPKRQEQH